LRKECGTDLVFYHVYNGQGAGGFPVPGGSLCVKMSFYLLFIIEEDILNRIPAKEYA
jgi:hypothetical protein